jgi:hypothetical protein
MAGAVAVAVAGAVAVASAVAEALGDDAVMYSDICSSNCTVPYLM